MLASDGVCDHALSNGIDRHQMAGEGTRHALGAVCELPCPRVEPVFRRIIAPPLYGVSHPDGQAGVLHAFRRHNLRRQTIRVVGCDAAQASSVRPGLLLFPLPLHLVVVDEATNVSVLADCRSDFGRKMGGKIVSLKPRRLDWKAAVWSHSRRAERDQLLVSIDTV